MYCIFVINERHIILVKISYMHEQCVPVFPPMQKYEGLGTRLDHVQTETSKVKIWTLYIGPIEK